jgi:hypothetical protein
MRDWIHVAHIRVYYQAVSSGSITFSELLDELTERRLQLNLFSLHTLLSRVAQLVQCLDYGMDDRSSIPCRGERICPLASVSRPAVGSTQPRVQCVPGVLSPGLKRGRGVTLTTHPHLVPRSKMSRSCTSPRKRPRGV